MTAARLGLLALVLGVSGCADVLDIRTSRFLAEGGDGRCTGTLRVRVLSDLTGSTRDVGVPAHKGVTDALREIAQAGGIRGCPLEVEVGDTKYDVETTLAVYREWTSKPDWSEVSTVFAMGTPMIQALGPLLADEQKLLMSTALNGQHASPIPRELDVGVPSLSRTFVPATVPVRKRSPGYPFVFFQGTDYTTQARIAMSSAWKGGATRVAFFACTTSAFCTDPVDGAKSFLTTLGGTKVGRDLAIELTDDEATVLSKVDDFAREELAKKTSDPTYTVADWVWFGNSNTTLVHLGRALAAVKKSRGWSPKVITNNWSLDETLYPACGDACLGITGIHPYPVFGDRSSPGMQRVLDLHAASRAADGEPATAYATLQYVYGVVAVGTWRAAVEDALDAGKRPDGLALKDALERFAQRSIENLGAISYSTRDHRPQSSARLYTLAAGGKLQQVGQPVSIALQPDWLGW